MAGSVSVYIGITSLILQGALLKVFFITEG